MKPLGDAMEAICNAGGALERPVWRVSAAEVDGVRGAVLAPTAELCATADWCTDEGAC